MRPIAGSPQAVGELLLGSRLGTWNLRHEQKSGGGKYPLRDEARAPGLPQESDLLRVEGDKGE